MRGSRLLAVLAIFPPVIHPTTKTMAIATKVGPTLVVRPPKGYWQSTNQKAVFRGGSRGGLGGRNPPLESICFLLNFNSTVHSTPPPPNPHSQPPLSVTPPPPVGAELDPPLVFVLWQQQAGYLLPKYQWPTTLHTAFWGADMDKLGLILAK